MHTCFLKGHQGQTAFLMQVIPTLANVPSMVRVSTLPPLYSCRYAKRTAAELMELIPMV